MFIFVLCFYTTLSWAQSSHESAWFETSTSGVNVITRARNPMQNITYLEEYVGGQYIGAFVLSATNGSSFSKIRFISGYRVNDFCIFEDTVYFCGDNRSETQAIVGKFAANDIMDASPDKYTYYHPWGYLYLKKIAVFRLANSSLQCLCIGKVNIFQTGSPENCILRTNFQKDMSNPPLIYYTNFYIGNNNNGLPKEHYSDIVVSNHHVSIVGYQVGTPNLILIRRIPLSVPYIGYNNIELYLCPNTPSSEMFSSPHAVSMDGDTIAIASLCTRTSGSGYETRVRFIDISNMKMLHSQSYTLSGQNDILAMTYVPDIRSVIISQQLNSDCKIFPLLHNQDYAYDTWGIRHHNSGCYMGLCTAENKYIVATDGSTWFSKDVSQDPNFVSHGCYVADKQHVDIITNLSYVKSSIILSSNPDFFDVKSQKIINRTITKINNCINP